MDYGVNNFLKFGYFVEWGNGKPRRGGLGFLVFCFWEWRLGLQICAIGLPNFLGY